MMIPNEIKTNHRKMLLRHNADRDTLNSFRIEQLIKGEKTKLSFKFKELMMYETKQEHLSRFYNVWESQELLSMLLQYYTDNIQVYPNYCVLDEYEIFQENILTKQKLIDILEESFNSSEQSNNSFKLHEVISDHSCDPNDSIELIDLLVERINYEEKEAERVGRGSPSPVKQSKSNSPQRKSLGDLQCIRKEVNFQEDFDVRRKRRDQVKKTKKVDLIRLKTIKETVIEEPKVQGRSFRKTEDFFTLAKIKDEEKKKKIRIIKEVISKINNVRDISEIKSSSSLSKNKVKTYQTRSQVSSKFTLYKTNFLQNFNKLNPTLHNDPKSRNKIQTHEQFLLPLIDTDHFKSYYLATRGTDNSPMQMSITPRSVTKPIMKVSNKSGEVFKHFNRVKFNTQDISKFDKVKKKINNFTQYESFKLEGTSVFKNHKKKF